MVSTGSSKVSNERAIGYARIDAEGDRAILDGWIARLRGIEVREVFTDVGPLPDAVTGLRRAIGSMKVNDALIHPEACLRELTVADIPSVFARIPDGTALKFFQPCALNEYASGDDMTSIRLIKAECENADG